MTSTTWITIKTRPVEVNFENFHYVCERWREHPELIFKGVTSVEIEKVELNNNNLPPSTSTTPTISSTTTLALTNAVTTSWKVKRRVHCSHYVAPIIQKPKDLPSEKLEDKDFWIDDYVYFITDEKRMVFEPIYDHSLAPLRESFPKFYPKCSSFSFVYSSGLISMQIIPLPDETSAEFMEKLSFVAEKMLKKLGSWSKLGPNYKKNSHHDSLVTFETFKSVHTRLKKKFTIWTDLWKARKLTSKYVHEDIAIASYFICIAEEERKTTGIAKEKQTFIDLGCGNGFLVHILSSEGYIGFGIDLNFRECWKLYDGKPFKTDLRAQAFDPSKASFPGTHWFIGNHADELTPWVPVISARSGFESKFINIPCCFFRFDGKFEPNDDKIGKYQTYLKWLANEVSKICGYQIETDWLRMPSTKNICHVGRIRTFQLSEEAKTRMEIEQMLSKVKPFELRDISKSTTRHGKNSINGQQEKGKKKQQSEEPQGTSNK